jgi:CheY-like chemotaxis protein
VANVFISNAQVQRSGDIVIDDSFNVEKWCLDDEVKSGDNIFIIDVHCVVKGAESMQQQGGVIIYRHLLRIFQGCQDKLKVIFYSPLTLNHLVSLHPENYILKLIPFIELYPTDSNGAHIEDWSFDKALQAVIDENNFLQFNNASENLMSGWALAGAQQINLKGKKLLVIEDEWRQWEAAYRVMLHGPVDYFLKDAADIKAEFGRLNAGAFGHLSEESLAQYDLIISDLYLNEAHETDTWKTEDVINSISGFRLFQKVRRIEPAVPVLFHTTSAKYRMFETLTALGADGQLAKNIKPNPPNNEKLETAVLFRQSLKSFLSPYSDCWLNSFYRFLSNEQEVSGKWWANLKRVKNNPSIRKEVIDIVRSIIIGVKAIKRNKPEYFDMFFPDAEIKPMSLMVSGIISNAGKLFEEQLLNAALQPEIKFIYKLRNHTAHSSNYHIFNFGDVLILIGLLEKTLREEQQRKIKQGEDFKSPFNNSHKHSHPLFEYVHYYNNWFDYIPRDLAGKFKDRINSLLFDYWANHWKTYAKEMREKIITEIRYIGIGNAVKPQFSKGSCRILLPV